MRTFLYWGLALGFTTLLPSPAHPESLRVRGEKVELRAEPSRSSAVLAVLAQGTEVELIESSEIWAKILVPEKNLEGYVASGLLEPLKPPSGRAQGDKPAPSSVTDAQTRATGPPVTPGIVNVKAILRSEPESNATTLAVLEPGTEVSIIRSEGRWHRVRAGSAEGWLLRAAVAAPAIAAVAVAGAAGSPRAQAGTTHPVPRGQVLRRANLRSAPRNDGTIMTTLEPGSQLEIVGSEGFWYKVRSQEFEGYVAQYLVRPSPPAEASGAGQKTEPASPVDEAARPSSTSSTTSRPEPSPSPSPSDTTSGTKGGGVPRTVLFGAAGAGAVAAGILVLGGSGNVDLVGIWTGNRTIGGAGCVTEYAINWDITARQTSYYIVERSTLRSATSACSSVIRSLVGVRNANLSDFTASANSGELLLEGGGKLSYTKNGIHGTVPSGVNHAGAYDLTRCLCPPDWPIVR